MNKLPSLSDKKIIRALERAGFCEAPTRGKGSHRAFVKEDQSGRVWLTVVPKSKDVPRGTLLAIIEQAGLTRDEFLKLI